MPSPILVTGGTGTLGRLVTPLLRDAGHVVRVLSRHSHEPADGIEYVACDRASPTTPVGSCRMSPPRSLPTPPITPCRQSEPTGSTRRSCGS